MGRRRVWCETLPLPDLARPDVLRLLARRDLELLAAVRPRDLADVPPLLRAAAAEGVRVGLWPMLDDRDGRWASAHNLAPFARFVDAVLDAVDDAPAPAELAVDLEPPIGLLTRLVSSGPEARRPDTVRPPLAPARSALAALVEGHRARGLEVSAAVVPMVLFDRHADGAWQRWMATPVDGIAWSHVSAMAYTSLFEGWSRGALARADALCLLADCCRRGRRRWGAAAGVSLGAVSTGALGDEPVYRGPHELREDVAVAVASGVDDLTLFDLAGALRRGDADAWLEAFTDAPSHAPRVDTTAAKAVALTARALGRFPW